MFIHRRMISLKETDATGVLYFSEMLKFGLEALEAYFKEKNFTLQHLVQSESFLMPIVHAEADFTRPLHAGDEVVIYLSLASVGTSSFTLQTRVIKEKDEAGRCKIVHVAVDKKSQQSIPIPEKILLLLHAIKSPSEPEFCR